ncbi:MAG TPA: DEAD/DEAH box helicase family protein [Longimicrobiales bacterium]|nr:DEAD/DEAH box helicase family protein [Longimicrobiales bacterium]
MADVVIQNPVINSPFTEPVRHFEFGDRGITGRILEGTRRESSYFVPIPHGRRQTAQLTLEAEWTRDRLRENELVNRIREKVGIWRRGGHAGVTPTTARLLQYWTNPDRDRKLFFCQIEAAETAIYIAEVAARYGDGWITNQLREANATGGNPDLFRLALKMATGAGKTVVMGMLIAWQALNKLASPQDGRFSDAFLLICPGITIRDRLRVLLPNDPDSYYRQRDLLPPDLLERLERARIVITNYHAFIQRERGDAARLTKELLGSKQTGAFTETPDQMVRRVCRELGNKRGIIVINDEAHHCYRGRVDDGADKLKGEERKEAAQREEEARVWLSGIEAINRKMGVKTVYDLSATPFFLRGSGWPEGTLFPWVVSDFSLIDAIESGIVKVPRVPVDDNQMSGTLPTYRQLWEKIRTDLPRKGRGTEAVTGEPVLPVELEGAIESLYENYRKYHDLWLHNEDARAKGLTAPVFIVVCNNTNVSKLVFDYIAGWERVLDDDTARLVPGKLELFSNVVHGVWSARPTTILVDSQQLESGEGMSAEFKKIAAREIDEFKQAYRERFPGRDADELTDEDLLREVMNTVGKPDKLGEHVKCVVSVSMLTEGWDANTVTHVLGVRAFGTQLLCEQVVGRALRRRSYAPSMQCVELSGGPSEFIGFDAEYAEVYGVPFSFIPCAGSAKEPRLGPIPTRVHALPEREGSGIRFPRVLGYRYELADEKIEARFTDDSRTVLSPQDVPTRVEVQGVIGPYEIHTLDDLKRIRPQQIHFLLAKVILEKYYRPEEGESPRAWLFPQLVRIARDWYEQCVDCKDDAFPQLLYFAQHAHNAADRIYRSIAAAEEGSPRLRPILAPYEWERTTSHVDFDTTRPVYATRDKCHVSHIVCDTGSWEQKVAQSLEDMDEVRAYVKNDRQPGFSIPYTVDGEQRDYYPDFIARVNDGNGTDDDDLLNVIIEVTGEMRREKEAKVATARRLWVPAVNNHGGFGRWAVIEITDPWRTKALLRQALTQPVGAA